MSRSCWTSSSGSDSYGAARPRHRRVGHQGGVLTGRRLTCPVIATDSALPPDVNWRAPVNVPIPGRGELHRQRGARPGSDGERAPGDEAERRVGHVAFTGLISNEIGDGNLKGAPSATPARSRSRARPGRRTICSGPRWPDGPGTSASRQMGSSKAMPTTPPRPARLAPRQDREEFARAPARMPATQSDNRLDDGGRHGVWVAPRRAGSVDERRYAALLVSLHPFVAGFATDAGVLYSMPDVCHPCRRSNLLPMYPVRTALFS